MKYIAIFLTLIISLSACSSPKEDNLANSNKSNSNSMIVSNANSKMIPLEGVDPSQFNANTDDIPVANRTPVNQESTVGPRSAPDNSTVNTVMRPDGSVAETRAFKNHPELLKVERVTNGTKVSLKVYLKNGKVVDVPKEKLPEFQVIDPGNILLAAGIKPSAVQPKISDKKSEPEGKTGDKPR